MDNLDTDVVVEYQPESAVAGGGDWLIVSVEKIWINSEVKNATDQHRFGASITMPFGTECRVAFPLVDNPTSELPKGIITLEQFEDRLLKAAVQLTRMGIKHAAKPIEFS